MLADLPNGNSVPRSSGLATRELGAQARLESIETQRARVTSKRRPRLVSHNARAHARFWSCEAAEKLSPCSRLLCVGSNPICI